MTEKIKQCPKCGKVFMCTHNTECWCMKYEISEEKNKQILEKYSNCLCEDCLKEYGSLKKN